MNGTMLTLNQAARAESDKMQNEDVKVEAPADAGSPFVTLVSSDGFEFHLRRSSVMRSSVLRNMLNPDSAFFEAKVGICHLNEISGCVLEKIAEYFYHAEKHQDSVGVADMDIPAELCLEILIAADFLDT